MFTDPHSNPWAKGTLGWWLFKSPWGRAYSRRLRAEWKALRRRYASFKRPDGSRAIPVGQDEGGRTMVLTIRPIRPDDAPR